MGSKILDASAFYAGVPFKSLAEYYTTPGVYEEIRHIKKNQGILDMLCEIGRLKIVEPKAESTRAAVRAARESGDFRQMSIQDISIIALGLEIGGEIITDDFAVSNVADKLNMCALPVMTTGIRDAGKWIHYCPACKISQKTGEKCDRCGTRLKRKLFKR